MHFNLDDLKKRPDDFKILERVPFTCEGVSWPSRCLVFMQKMRYQLAPAKAATSEATAVSCLSAEGPRRKLFCIIIARISVGFS